MRTISYPPNGTITLVLRAHGNPPGWVWCDGCLGTPDLRAPPIELPKGSHALGYVMKASPRQRDMWMADKGIREIFPEFPQEL